MGAEARPDAAGRAPLPRGARLAIDVGTARVGLAASDPDGLVATPVETVPRKPEQAALRRIAQEAAERFAAVVYVGLPKHLSGAEGASSADARAFAGGLVRALADAGQAATELRFVDERMTTVTATQALHAAGRTTRKHRSVIDQAAAVIILQSALDAERATGARAGIGAEV
ncbi:Holliday junction resolvase RuvX [Myceligenerans pegani]|uniref:Putative pre-16S rRNA nuclease n=1 Tax=Myceligenerans pegani TaxID=2776917 RepID=A0ABR9MVP9_9MICO|nr:Holliday junction resolvase RuvX [Myceligenerans sp. TRM 65318]MBE1875004.1 Holliday junction resolvase RuvX [Myceligenerans sp. TRM 65318]MBE3017275.1 Holliday junction resolvase RuvX [Myceligenerans sp. TRM 65318]